MDYLGFILLGLGLIGLTAWGVGVIVLYVLRHPARRLALRLLAVGSLLVCGLGWWLYQSYSLDDGLVGAAVSEDTSRVRWFLAHGTNPNSPGEDGSTALSEAGRAGHPDVVALLRRAGGRKGQGP